jgi:hypothetical protein
VAEWFIPTIVLLPFAAWMFLGVGLPWALVLLPRPLWHERSTVLAVSMALGPPGLTAVMFALGTFYRITLAGTLAGSGILFALGVSLAVRRGLRARLPVAGAPLTPNEWDPLTRLLGAGIALLVLANVIVTAYWPFVDYDPQWVYGYEARDFVQQKRIPDRISFYPLMIPLGYTYMQQAWGLFHDPAINDHAARVIVPWFNAAMVLMMYAAGRHLFGSRRAGLLAAAVWAFYPHVAAWSSVGDLEIPLALYMTGATVFFVEAWRTGCARYAVLSGLLLGGALWTKPTGGALALGMALAEMGWLVVVRFRWSKGWPKLRTAMFAGLTSAPLGGMWYVRNLALGHAAVVFPAAYWHDYARRSGQELGWPILIAALVTGGLVVGRTGGSGQPHCLVRTRLIPLLALILLVAGALPTALNPAAITQGDNVWRWVRGDLQAARRLNAPEAALIIAGMALLVWSGRGVWRAWPPARRATVGLLWALLVPYAVVWFLDFSYHYRLSLAIVPLMAVQVAALIDGWLWDWLAHSPIRRAAGVALAAGAITLAMAVGLARSVSVWRSGGLPDDRAKYDYVYPALMAVVHGLEDYAAEHGPPVVVIPGEDRLPFFFLDWDIRNSRDAADLPTRLEDLDGADLYIENSEGAFLMYRAGIWPNALAADAALGAAYSDLGVLGWDGQPWPTVLKPLPMGPHGSRRIEDGNFYYTAFTIHPEARTAPMHPRAMRHDDVIIGGFVRFIGHDAAVANGEMILSLYWRPTDQAPPPREYLLFIQLSDEAGNLLVEWDGVQPLQGAYPTRFWRPGESLLDYHILRIPEGISEGPVYVRIGYYDPVAGARLPVTVNREAAGDSLTIGPPVQAR